MNVRLELNGIEEEGVALPIIHACEHRRVHRYATQEAADMDAHRQRKRKCPECRENGPSLSVTSGPMRHRCPECGKHVASYVPKGGDGSARLLRSHLCKDFERTAQVGAPGWEMQR